ncbi:MAG: YitT family protein [Clostridia bacterium]|nr:YitT family protein [Clostridia bacterium]
MKPKFLSSLFSGIRAQNVLCSLLGSAILAFGLYEIHAISSVTEGGVLGLTLLLERLFSLSPALSGFLLNALFYFLGWRRLGKNFLVYSAISAGGFSLFYGILEYTPRLWPALAQHPLWAALLGALFVGVGCGLAVRAGGAPGGDDALAMALSDRTHLPISLFYLISDLTVLSLSLLYIPLSRILYSLLTVVLSGQLVELVTRIGRKKDA